MAKIRREHMESFMEDQLKRWTPNTAANRYRSVQQFFKFLVDEGEQPPDAPPLRIQRRPLAAARKVGIGNRI